MTVKQTLDFVCGLRTDREQYTRTNAATAIILVKPAETLARD